MRGASIFLALGLISPGFAQQNCAIYNTGPGTFITMQGSQEHSSGGVHFLTTLFLGSCEYQGVFPGNPCDVWCSDDGRSEIGTYENAASVTNIFYKHAVIPGSQTGTAYSNGGAATCGSTVAVSVLSCLKLTSCSSTISISGSYNGIGGSITFAKDSIMNDSHQDTVSCMARTAPILGTPIIIDTDGKGFHLTSVTDGVDFDFFGQGPLQVSWTAPGSTNGFLALPASDGLVHSAHELFGDVDGYPNGFAKLAQYDSFSDGKIDSRDDIWPRLRVWIDANHDGVSQPEELHTLDEIGVRSISLQYVLSGYVDEYGNRFRFLGTLIPDPGDLVDRRIYDVILKFAGK